LEGIWNGCASRKVVNIFVAVVFWKEKSPSTEIGKLRQFVKYLFGSDKLEYTVPMGAE
jgi:hypothetical protein